MNEPLNAEPVEIGPGGSIKFNLTPKQKEMIDCNSDEVLVGGAAYGGKSLGLLLFAALRRMNHPRSQGIIFRRTYPELDKSIIRESFRVFLPLGAKFNAAKRCWVFSNGSIQDFAHCESDIDVFKYYSSQYHDMCFDEATQFNPYQIINLKTRCRSNLQGVKPLVRYATNPGGVSHNYFYEKFIKPSFVSKIWTDPETGKTFCFIPAVMQDNPFGMAADPDYDRRLKELPEKRYLALAKGRWDVFEGAYFDTFDPTPGVGVLRSPRHPADYTLKYISMDWGFSEPAAIHWWEVTPMGRIFCYRELYVTRLGPPQLAKRILDMCPPEEKYEHLVAPPEIWGKTSDFKEVGETIQEAMQKVFGDRINLIKANNARVEGWLKMRSYFEKAQDGLPWLQISPVCMNLIRTIPCAIHDEQRGEDISDKCETHCLDSARYFLMSTVGLPHETLTPFQTGYEKIFGTRHQTEGSRLVLPGRGGY